MALSKNKAPLLMPKNLIRKFNEDKPSGLNDQGIRHPSSFSFSSDFTNKNGRTSTRTIRKGKRDLAVLSISENRILLVDDEYDLSALFNLVLERSGFSVDVFNDPVLALSNYKIGAYGLLLLDIRMPVMNGFELYQKIRDKDDRVKVCFITAFEEYHIQFQESFPNLEVDCFIRKPLPIDELVEIVKAKLNC